ncbi:MAG: gliding motility-associated protein GldE [Flavobacteriales bacterium]|nr:gliding motility-associated protein GldE [Flavobacteriales bacterium]
MDNTPLLLFDTLILAINWMAVWLPGVAVIALLVCSALISASEVAMFSLSPAQKEDLAQSKDRTSAHIIELLQKPDRENGPKRLLATILIANNSINIAIVLLATRITLEFLQHYAIADWAEFLISVVLVTFLLVMFGEVIPKVYATGHNMQVARFMALPLVVIQKIFTPLSWFLRGTSTIFENRIRARSGGSISVGDLGHALELTADEERSDEEHKILEGIVTFGAKEVGQIMTSRMDILALQEDEPVSNVIKFILEKGYSRIPVYRTSLDEISGFLFIKDLIPYLDEKEFDWKQLIKPSFFVPENKKIDDLLQEFQKQKVHLAIVVDEYGGTSGLVTLEDILEEVVGDISDEFDEEELRYSKLDERNYLLEGKTSLVDLYKMLEIDPTLLEEARGDSSTLGGFILEQAGKIPLPGDQIFFEGFTFTIETADTRMIKRVKITLPENNKSKEE